MSTTFLNSLILFFKQVF
jgi:Holliday junction resolvase RusA-like endonuclease